MIKRRLTDERYRPTGRHALFTLIELLTVIGIIAVLAAILLPVLGRAKTSAQEAVCVSNLRQIAIGFANYGSAFDRWYPYRHNHPDEGSEVTHNYPAVSWSWKWGGKRSFDLHKVIEEYVPPSGVYACPLQDETWDECWPTSWWDAYEPDVDFYVWPGYATSAGYLVDERIGYKPDGGSIQFGHNPSLNTLRRWREIIALRVGDHLDRPFVGDSIRRSDPWWEGRYHTPHADDSFTWSMEGVSANMAYPDGSVALYRGNYEKWSEAYEPVKAESYWRRR